MNPKIQGAISGSPFLQSSIPSFIHSLTNIYWVFRKWQDLSEVLVIFTLTFVEINIVDFALVRADSSTYWVILSVSESEVSQSCPILCNPMDSSLPGSSVHGIFQARVLEWVTISFSRGSSQPRDRTHCRQALYHLSHQESPGHLE